MFLSSTKEINRSLKEINTLLSEGISNTYWIFTIEKNWHTQKFDFVSLKSSSPGQFLGSSNLQISLNFQTSCCNLKIRVLGAKLYVAFLLFLFWKELW